MKTAQVARLIDKSEKVTIRLANEGFLPCRIIPGRRKIYIWNRRCIEEYITGREQQDVYQVKL